MTAPTRSFPIVIATVLLVSIGNGACGEKNGYTKEDLLPFLNAESVKLLSLRPSNDSGKDPFGPERPLPVVTPHGECHGNPILGRVEIREVDEIELIRKAVTAIHEDALDWDGSAVGCFWPRHCLRVSTGEGIFEMLICYQCTGAYLFHDGKRVGYIHFNNGTPKPVATAEILNSLLRKRNFLLSPL